MYEYLKVNNAEQEQIKEFLPTIQIKLKKGSSYSLNHARFMNEIIKNFYEKPELFKDANFKARVKLLEVLKAIKDKDVWLSEKYDLEKRTRNFIRYCDYFKKKKYIKVETLDGKIARKNNIMDAYAVLTPLGIQELLNLDKVDLLEELNPFLKKYLDEYNFILEENKKYIKSDSEKIKAVLSDLFKDIIPILREKYLNHYMDILKKAEHFMSLTKKEQSEFITHKINNETKYFIYEITECSYIGYGERIYSMKFTEDELKEYINSICENRIKLDEEEFVRKIAFKVGSIIKNRRYTIEGKINTDLESLLKINLSDGASFKVKTQIVGVMNQYDTFFFRKPTTFHNVYLANGENLKNPSYDKLVRYL